MTFLEIANNVAIGVRLPEMTACFSSADRNAKVIKLSIINAAERDIFRGSDWSFLTKRHAFTTIDGTDNYSLPADYHRSIPTTFWNNTSQRVVLGPTCIESWAMYRNNAFGVSAIDYVCKILPVDGVNKLFLIPTPGGEEAISYYYISDRYVKYRGILVPAFTGDDNETIFDDDLVESGALYRTLRTLGLDYGEERLEFTSLRKERTSHDGGAEILNMAPGYGSLGANTPLVGMG
jgi:hypothetical protein